MDNRIQSIGIGQPTPYLGITAQLDSTQKQDCASVPAVDTQNIQNVDARRSARAIYDRSSHDKDDIAALDMAKEQILKGSLEAMLAAANLLLHRAKNPKGIGFALYDEILKRIDHGTEDGKKLAIKVLDNKWRMIHHHPILKLGNTEDCLKIVAEIRVHDPKYVSPELAILHDFTLGNYDEAKKEYQALLEYISDKDRDLEDGYVDTNFWFYEKTSILYLLGSLEVSGLLHDLTDEETKIETNSHLAEGLDAFKKGYLETRKIYVDRLNQASMDYVSTCDTKLKQESILSIENSHKAGALGVLFEKEINPDHVEQILKEFLEGQHAVKNREYMPLTSSDEEELNKHVKFVNQLRKNELDDFAVVKDIMNRREAMNKVIDAEIVGTVADVLAPRNPKLALTLYQISAMNEPESAYAVGDFQEEPTVSFPEYKLEDFLPPAELIKV